MKKWLSKAFTNNWRSNGSRIEILYVYLYDKKIGSLAYDGELFTFKYEVGVSEVEHIIGIQPERPSKYLAPFFTARIPSEGRPEVAEEVKKYANDPIKLLATLGSQSAISPYRFTLGTY